MNDTSDTVTKVSKKNLNPFDRETQTDFPQFFKNSLKYVRKHLPFPLADGTVPPPPAKRRKKSGLKAGGPISGSASSGDSTAASGTQLSSSEKVAPPLIDLVCDSTTQAR